MPLQTRAQPFKRARAMAVCLKLLLVPYSVCANRKSSSQTWGVDAFVINTLFFHMGWQNNFLNKRVTHQWNKKKQLKTKFAAKVTIGSTQQDSSKQDQANIGRNRNILLGWGPWASYHNDSKFPAIQLWVKSTDPDKTEGAAWSGYTLVACQSAFNTLWQNHIV